MKLAELLEPWVSSALPENEVSGLQNDSRKVKPGDLFFAYPGVVADGRMFIQQAIHNGAMAVVYEPASFPEIPLTSTSIPHIPIPELGKNLAAIACRFYQNPSQRLTVTGVTGTNGKTTIAYQLAQAYQLLGQQSAYIGTLGQGPTHELQPLINTTPDALCLQQLLHHYEEEGVSQVCMEVSSHALHQKRVDGIAFSHAIYTNLSHEHLDYHKTMQAYASAKAELFANPTLKTAIINHDDPYALFMAESIVSHCQKLTYGLSADSDVHATSWQVTLEGSQLEVESAWGKQHLLIKALGTFNVSNALAIYASLLVNEVAVQEAAAVMARLKAAPGRMEVVNQEPCVIVDYAHTPDALQNVLASLIKLKQCRLWVVFGCGGDRDKEKRPMMGRIASQYADFVMVTSDNPRTEDPQKIINDILQGIGSYTKVLQMVDREQAIHKTLSLADKNDIILIAGKGHEAYQQVGHERFAFSDQHIIQTYFSP